MIVYADVIVDLQYGDTGKGKVAHALSASDDYNVVLRYNGGSNAGHTVYHNGIKVVTHQVPLGVLFGKKSIIGPGCVVNYGALYREIKELNSMGIKTDGLIFVDKRAHLVQQKHLKEDGSDEKIGTTRQGIGPTYRDKYGRTGVRIGEWAKSMNTSEESKQRDYFYNLLGVYAYDQPFQIVDIYDMLHKSEEKYRILCEGAQGFHLDIDWGEYPYVTSSHCTVGSACLNGIPPQKIRKIIGTMKAYETYVGNRNDYTDSEDTILNRIQQVGNEFGATTGRPRKVNWLHMDRVIQAINVNGVTDLIINKADVLEEVGIMKYSHEGITYEYNRMIEFQTYVEAVIKRNINTPLNKITWSMTPHGI